MATVTLTDPKRAELLKSAWTRAVLGGTQATFVANLLSAAAGSLDAILTTESTSRVADLQAQATGLTAQLTAVNNDITSLTT